MKADPAPVPKLPERRRLGRRVRDGVMAALLGLLAFAIGLALFNNLMMPRLIHSDAEVRVPDLSNLTYAQAEQLLASRQLRLGRSGERFDASVPRDFILAQDPLPDTPVRSRRRVVVMVSLGEEYSVVPELVGTSLRGATLAIEHAGLGFAGATRAPSGDLGEDMVVASDPSADAVVPHNWPVAVLLSTGASDQSYIMPDLLGRDIETLQGQLAALGLRVEIRGRRPSGPAIFQNPAPGSRIVGGTTVLLQAGGTARRADRERR